MSVSVMAGSLAGLGEVTAALVGRQNAGKTSLMMHLSGQVQRPVNFPGSSVERGEARVRVGEFTLRLVDLPGLASMQAVSPDEQVALDYLTSTGDDRPHVICAVVDAAKLVVELGLVAQLARLGRPLVVALNKLDVARAEGRPVDLDLLAQRLGVPVIATNALTGDGADLLRHALIRTAHIPHQPTPRFDPAAVVAEVQRPHTGPPVRTLTDRLDAVLLHRVAGLPILLLVMAGMFQALFTLATPFMTLVEGGQGVLADAVADAVPTGAVQSFLIDGLINGIGSVLIFLPQIALLMFVVALLEGTGYMARAAFLLDRVLSRFGLSGRSFVPMVSSFACAVPGVLASRIIENERDRIATIVVSPLMSCSARLPVYILLIGTFFSPSVGGLVLLAMYALGVVLAVLVALLLRKTVLRGPTSPLMMELPVYQRPSWRVVWAQVYAGGRDFVVLAGTVIFTATVIIWLLSYYPRPLEIHAGFDAKRAQAAETHSGDALAQLEEQLDAAEKGAYFEQSFLADIGRFIHPVFAPAGWDWKTSVGVVSAFPARELIIPTMGILYSLGEVDPGEFESLAGDHGCAGAAGLRDELCNAKNEDGTPAFTPLIAVALMVFFALCSQCVGTLAAIKRETRSWKWPAFTFAYMTLLGWLGAVLVYQVGSALGLG